VSIFTTQVVQGPAMRDYRGRVFRPSPRVGQSLGSGFLIDGAGNILTNTHVVADAQHIRVQFADGTEREARVVGVDPPTDVAVIRVEPFEGMATLPMGDSNAVRIGDWLVAIGNPFGLSFTVTAGILSARGRRDVPVGGRLRYVDFLQTDASINPGNSGGPLVNMAGEVIGINTAINADGQGIGFAIPINMVRDILPALLRGGSVSRSWLGVFIDRPTPEVARAAGLAQPHGAMVTRVVPGGPAEQAGLQPGDIIVRLGETPIERHDQLAWAASLAGVGSVLEVEVLRPAGPVILRTRMGQLPE
jgi:serine protease Do